MPTESTMMNNELNYERLREMIARCQWTFAKTMPWCPHEYIVRDKCPLTDDEFLYFVDMQRRFGVKERWGKYNNPYLYIDDYKYWTMGASMEETKVMNRAKACVVDDAHKLYEGMKETEGNEYIDEYIHKKLALKPDDKGYNINLLSGRLDELEACANHLKRIRRNYCSEVVKEWSTTSLNLDCEHNFPVYNGVQCNGVHPTAAGYNQMGDTYYSWMKYQLSK